MLSDIFQKQYDFEHQQRGELGAAVSNPVMAITVISGATAVVLLDFPYEESPLTYVFIGLIVLTIFTLFSATYFVFRSVWNYVYQKLASAPELAEHHKQLLTWHQEQGLSQDEASKEADIDFRKYIDERFSEAAEWNGKNNFRRGNFLHMSTTAIAVALALFIPTALIYAVVTAGSADRIHQVRITNFPQTSPEASMSTIQNSPSPAAAPGSSPSATPSKNTPTSSPKPIGPSNSEFRTNTELPLPTANSTSEKKT